MTNGCGGPGRRVVLVPALIAAMTAIGIWAMWPTCVAGSCLLAEAEPAASGTEMTKAVSVPSLGRPLPADGPGESLPLQARLKPSATQVEPDMQVQPATKIEPTRRDQGAPSPVDATGAPANSPENDDAKGDPLDADRVTEAAERTALANAERFAELAETALWDPDEQRRGEAIHAVGLRRDNDAIAVLTEVAISDSETSNRYEAVQSLWYAAADGVDEDGAAREALEKVLDDQDPDVAELAQRALDDLLALELRRAAE